MKGDASMGLCPSINRLHLQVFAFPLAKVCVYCEEMVIKKRGEEEGKIKGLEGRLNAASAVLRHRRWKMRCGNG